MEIEEIKEKIMLDGPYGTVPYKKNYKNIQLQERIDNFESWKRVFDGVEPEKFIWEFSNRQLGHTTELIIECLHHMSEGKTVKICAITKEYENHIKERMKKYGKQLGILMLYSDTNPDILRYDNSFYLTKDTLGKE